MMLSAQMASVAQAVFIAATDEETAVNELGAGFAGSFWVVLGLAVAVILLGVNMVRRLRRNQYRHEIREELEAELAEREAAAADPRAADPLASNPDGDPAPDDKV